MQNSRQIIDCYNKTAQPYAEKFYQELDHKPMERVLLKAFLQTNQAKGPVVDLGCGPGHVSSYLQQQGAEDLLGIDLAPEMVAVARACNPSIAFETGDMLNLQYADQSFGAALAFYSLIHFDDEELQAAFREIHRVLRPGGDFLFSFHLGDEWLHVDTFLDHKVSIDFRFLQPEQMRRFALEAGFEEVEGIERGPYPDIEYPSRRSYFWVRKHG